MQRTAKYIVALAAAIAAVAAVAASGALAGPMINIVLTAEPAGTFSGMPTHEVLHCEADCPRLTPARMKSPHAPLPGTSATTFDRIKNGNFGALLDLSIKVAADGHAQSVIVERSLGPKQFTDDMVAYAMKDTYEPATEGGKPVESSLRYRWVVESYVGDTRSRPEIIGKFTSVNDLLAHQSQAQALAEVDAALADPTLLLPDRAFISITRSNLCIRAGNYLCALDSIRDATVDAGTLLDPSIKTSVIRQRIELEARVGHYADALAWNDQLKTCCGIVDDAQSVALARSIAEALAKPDPLAVAGTIAPDASVSTWHHTLLRRTFAFQNVAGTLDRLELRCEARGFNAAIAKDSQWTVPKSWSGCELYVFGAPGTTFQLVEAL